MLYGPEWLCFSSEQINILTLPTHRHTHSHAHAHTDTHTLKESNFVCLDFVEFNISLDENINVNIIYKYKI